MIKISDQYYEYILDYITLLPDGCGQISGNLGGEVGLFVGSIRFFATVGDLRVPRYTTLQRPEVDRSACLRYTNWLHRTFYAGCQR